MTTRRPLLGTLGPSQRLYGEVFRRPHLVPDDPQYDRAGRERLFVATKTMGRFSNQPNPMPNFPKDPAPGFQGPWPPQLPPEFRNTAIDDLKRSLTQMFGDGKGYIMRAIRLDAHDVIDTLLVPLNANDRVYSSNQNNVLPLAMARGLGVIAMKVFAASEVGSRPITVVASAAEPRARG